MPARSAETRAEQIRRRSAGPLQRATAAVACFFCRPAHPAPLGVFRLGVGLLALAQCAIIWPYALQLHGNYGFVQWAVLEAGATTWLPSVGKLALLLAPLGVPSPLTVYLVLSLYIVALVGMLCGWRARSWAIAAWGLHWLLVNAGYVSLYGVDTMLHVCLFYCVFMPVGACLSVGGAWRRIKGDQRAVAPSFAAGLSIRVLQLHLCLIYLNTSIAKLRGPQWWSGEAIWRALMQPQFAVFDMSWLAAVPWLAQAICWSVLLIETGYAIFIWPRRTRPWWVAATLALHLGIGVLMGLWLFALTMVLMTGSAFGVEPLRRWWFERRSHRSAPDAQRPHLQCTVTASNALPGTSHSSYT